jgi:hypothetical protein
MYLWTRLKPLIRDLLDRYPLECQKHRLGGAKLCLSINDRPRTQSDLWFCVLDDWNQAHEVSRRLRG